MMHKHSNMNEEPGTLRGSIGSITHSSRVNMTVSLTDNEMCTTCHVSKADEIQGEYNEWRISLVNSMGERICSTSRSNVVPKRRNRAHSDQLQAIRDPSWTEYKTNSMNTITHVQGSDDGRMLSSGSGRFNLYPLPSRFELRTSSFHCRNEDGVSRRKSSGFFSKSRSILVSIRNRHRNDRFPSGKSLSSGSYDIENGNVAYPGAVSDCISYMRSCG